MNHGELLKAYKSFFIDSPAGKFFMQELDRLIADAHQKAESTPELARDFTQHAKGIRKVMDHIIGVGIEVKKR